MTWLSCLRVLKIIGLFSFVSPAGAEPALLLVPIDTTWRYDQSGEALVENWASAAFDDSSWPSGQDMPRRDLGCPHSALGRPEGARRKRRPNM